MIGSSQKVGSQQEKSCLCTETLRLLKSTDLYILKISLIPYLKPSTEPGYFTSVHQYHLTDLLVI